MSNAPGWWDLANMALAYALALPLGYELERDEHSLGLRTFPLMALACCAVVVIGTRVMPPDAQGRVLQGLLSGIGLLCAGAVIRERTRVHGTSTAAALLGTAAIGVAVAYRLYDIAVVLAVFIYLTLRLFRPLKLRLDREK